jgi:hypothetical protein
MSHRAEIAFSPIENSRIGPAGGAASLVLTPIHSDRGFERPAKPPRGSLEAIAKDAS